MIKANAMPSRQESSHGEGGPRLNEGLAWGKANFTWGNFPIILVDKHIIVEDAFQSLRGDKRIPLFLPLWYWEEEAHNN